MMQSTATIYILAGDAILPPLNDEELTPQELDDEELEYLGFGWEEYCDQ